MISCDNYRTRWQPKYFLNFGQINVVKWYSGGHKMVARRTRFTTLPTTLLSSGREIVDRHDQRHRFLLELSTLFMTLSWGREIMSMTVSQILWTFSRPVVNVLKISFQQNLTFLKHAHDMLTTKKNSNPHITHWSGLFSLHIRLEFNFENWKLVVLVVQTHSIWVKK